MKRKLSESFGVLAVLGAAILLGSGCTPTDRDFASGGAAGAGGAGGAGGQGGGCPAGFVECDGDPNTVCETDTMTNLGHCGTCDKACSEVIDANIECVAGKCSITSCNNGRGNCDNFYDNGCESNPTTSFEHCGTCGNSCEAPDAITACVAGSCQLAQCVAGKLDCDMNPMTGCEVNPATNVDHCSACGMACKTPNGTMTCMDSMCAFDTCNTGFADCNKFIPDGCEVDLLSDPHNCTACGASCKGGTCKAGVCTTPELVAKTAFSPGKMAIFKDVIYFGSRSTNGEFASVPVAGGTPVLLGTVPGSTNAVVVSVDGIFVAASAGVQRMALDGSNKVSYGNQTARGIAVTPNEVYWTTLSNIRKGQLIALPLPITVATTASSALGLFIDNKNEMMYWSLVDGSLWSSPLAPFSQKQLATGPLSANNVVSDAKNVYWSSTKGVHSVSTTGGNVIDFGGSSSVRSVSVDATYVYWTDETGGLVQRALKDGSAAAEIVAIDQAGPYGLALDSQFVYWSASGGNEIWKLPK